MTTLTLRDQRGHFTVTGPNIEPLKFKSRREAKDWCARSNPARPSKKTVPDAAKRATKWKGTEGGMTALKLRPTGLGSPVDSGPDYIYHEERRSFLSDLSHEPLPQEPAEALPPMSYR
jgi:hypothetical protein